MHIIIHVQQWLLNLFCLGSSDAIPRTCDREYEKCLIVSVIYGVGQATQHRLPPYLIIRALILKALNMLAHNPHYNIHLLSFQS